MEPLKLLYTKKEWFFFLSFLITIIFLNTFFEYQKFKQFKSEELYVTSGKILNIYPKENRTIIKIKTNNFTFFTSVSKNTNFQKLQYIHTTLITKKVNFISYLKGFYAPTFNNSIIKKENTLKNILNSIDKQHTNKNISQLFKTLFFAIPLNKEIQHLCSIYGISHLVAISGFHLGILSLVVFTILNIIYTPIHQNYFPYRNKKFDILIITTITLFIYLIYIDIVPSFLRAFIMFILGIYFLRSNIKILSFETLLITILFIIALFPKLIFSLSLWFSVAGVFYIFLFLHYFKNINKFLSFILLNFWIYFAMNPITHYFFGTTSFIQLLSPFFTMGFTIFYPIELFLHFINYGYALDYFIEFWLNTKPYFKDIFTPLWFFIYYIIISILSIFFKKSFWLLNISFIMFNFYLFAKL